MARILREIELSVILNQSERGYLTDGMLNFTLGRVLSPFFDFD